MVYLFVMAARTKAIFLLLPLVLSSCGEDPSKPKECSIEDIYSYPYRVFYSDSYFSGDSTKEDIRLASLSMAMTQATQPYRSEAHPESTEYIERILETSGMGNLFLSPAYFEPPAPDTTAFGIASKKMQDDSNLVWVFIGTGTRATEWADNFALGEEGDAQGFLFAAEQVRKGLGDYLVEKGIEGKTSLYVTGYSRCGAIANLLGGMLDDEIESQENTFGKAEVDFRRTYVYTVEAPAASINAAFDSEKYANIHNYYNLNDPIPVMAPRTWGFHRLGVDHCYPDRLTDIRYAQKKDTFLTFLKQTVGKSFDYPDDTWDALHDPAYSSFPSYSRFLQPMVSEFAEQFIHDRVTYADNYEEAVGWLVEFFMEDPRSSYLISIIRTSLIGLALYKDALIDAATQLVSGQIEEGKAKLFDICDKVFRDKGHAKEIIAEILRKAEPLFPLIREAMESSEEFDLDGISQISSGIYPFHERYPTAIWIMTGDSQYGYNEEAWTNDGSYYHLKLSPYRDFSLSTADGTKMFVSANGQIETSYVSASIEQEELHLYLPKNATYEYKAIYDTGISLSDVNRFGDETIIKQGMAPAGTF